MVGSIVVTARMVSLKCLKELHQDLIFSLLALQNIGMLGCVVNTLNVVDVDVAIAITVDLLVSLGYRLLSARVHGSS